MSDEALETVENVMAEANAPSTPMDAKSEGDLSVPNASPERGAVEEAFLSLDRDGKQISLDQAKAKQYAQKGFDYETKMHNLRVDKQLFDREKTKLEEQYKELKEINEYAKQNPEWERFLHEQWQARQAPQQYGQQVGQQQLPDNQLYTLQSKLSQMESIINSQQEDMKARKEAELDSRLQTEIDTYKEQYPDFDWKSEDELGQSLEHRIQQHAIDNGIKGYTAAARDYLWDEHMKRVSLNSKEQAGKAVQRQNSLGLGKVTKESQAQVQQAKDFRNKSYHDLAEEALREFGIN